MPKWDPNSEHLPLDPEEANRLFCKICGSGDIAALRAHLQRGVDPNGYWDPDRARERTRATYESLNYRDEQEPDPYEFLSEDLRKELKATMKEQDEAMLEQDVSAPASWEIPLFCAVESRSEDCLAALLEAGANPKIRDNSNRSAMYYANSTPIMRTLLAQGVPLEDVDEYEWSPLVGAINDGEAGLERIRSLIEVGANVNGTHDHGYTVFMSAVGSSRDMNVLKTLIAAGADPHALSEYGYNAFHAAIDVNGEANEEQSVRETLRYLRELGVDLEHRTVGGHTPLSRAINHGSGIEVRVLCELGADVNAVCPMRQCGLGECEQRDLPLLFHALSGWQCDIVIEALLQFGADPLAKDEEGFRPLEVAVSRLCSEAPDYEGSYRRFFQEIEKAIAKIPGEVATRDEFLQSAKPVLQKRISEFASSIPIEGDSTYDRESRVALISCLASLVAYEVWASNN